MDSEDDPIDHSRMEAALPSPTDEMLEDPRFEAIWQRIKTWDIAVPEAYGGYCGATGSHVRAILDALAIHKQRSDMSDVERTRKGLEAAIRSAKLALFVINKHVAMPNDSWASGFDADLKAAEDALAAMTDSNGVRGGK